MSTYLQLCQALKRECGIAGPTATPATVVGQTGVLEKVVNWVDASHRDIQLKSATWRWMRKPFTLATVPGTDAYAYGTCTDVEATGAIARFSSWWAQDTDFPFTCYLPADGIGTQQRLIYLPLARFNALYRFGPQQLLTGRPVHVSVDNSDRLLFGPNPDAIYTIGGEFQRGPQILTADSDTPDMPDRFQDLIVYYAMQRYAANAVAAEVLARANLEGNRILRALELSQLPTAWGMAAPLA